MDISTSLNPTLTDLLFQRARDGLCLLDWEGKVRRANAEWLRLLGRSVEGVAVDTLSAGLAVTQRLSTAAGLEFAAWPVALDGGDGVLVTVKEKRPPGIVLEDFSALPNGTSHRLLFNSMAEAFALHEIVLDDHGEPCDYRFLEVNPAFERLTGLASSEILGKRVLEVLPVLDPEWIRLYGKVALTGQPMRFDKYEPTLRRHYEVYAYCPAHLQFAALFLDITERKSAEAALRKSEELYRTVVTNLAEGVIVQDVSGGILAMNPAAEALLGPAADDMRSHPSIVPKSRLRLVREDGSPLPPDEFPAAVALRTGKPQVAGIVGVVRPDDSVTWIRGNIVLLKDPEDRVSGLVSTISDITERRSAETRLRALVENGSDIIIVVGRDGLVQFASPNVFRTFGRSAKETEGASGFEFVHPDDQPKFMEALASLLAAPAATGRVEGRVRHRDGSWRIVEATGRNLLDDPAVQGVVINARDVTEQRRLEARFHETQKMESVGRLAGGVAHDFNNLLTVILSGADELKLDLDTNSPIDRELVEDLGEAGIRARDLTRQLLAFARKQVIAPVVLDINDVVRGSETILRRAMGEDVEVAVALQDGLWTTFSDPGQVEQVLVNLAVNARDAMPSGGRLTIKTRNSEVQPGHFTHDPEERPGQWVRLIVSDSGRGMSVDDKKHLFEPFFTTKGPGKSTGLGLATVHGIVGQSGGHIHVRSESGQGATFQVCFPRMTGPAPKAKATHPTGTSVAGTETVLVVEDDPGVLEIAVRALRDRGYEVIVASDGREALGVSTQELARVQLLVTDIIMPGLNGRDVADELRRRCPGLPVLFMSGYTQGVFLDGLPPDGGAQFLAKPFTASEFLASVRAVLDAAKVR